MTPMGGHFSISIHNNPQRRLYARVSTTDQNLEIQEAALRAAGCEVIRSEKRSGTTTAGREELRTVIDFLRKGEISIVHGA
jgi:DNA invertase Pin-like site-specific DNA recombinase